MDKFGVPRKVNRNVVKAIYELNYEGLEEPNLSNICDLVELYMKNNVPLPNLQNVVRQSLQNLYKLGVIEKKGKYYYRNRTDLNVESLPPKPIVSKHINTNVFKKAYRKDKESSLNPNNRKRVLLSEDSIPENDPRSSIKRFRTSKILSRIGRKVELPKVRKSHNINNYQSNLDSGKEQERRSSSCFENESDNENTTDIDNNGDIDDLPLSVNDISHKKIDSQIQTQTNQLNNSYDAKIRIKKLDEFNVSGELQLDEVVENKQSSHSECNQNINVQQKEPIKLEHANNINDESGFENSESSHWESNQTTNEQNEEPIALETEQNNKINNDGSNDQTSQKTRELILQDS